MPRNYVPLQDGIEFKNLLSWPAQVGKILNYIILAWQWILKHKAGTRYDTLENHIWNARCLEFMMWLWLVRFERIDEDSSINMVRLTSRGMSINNILLDNAIYTTNFNSSASPDIILEQLRSWNALNVVHVIERAFRDSIVFKDLCVFLDVDNVRTQTIEYNKTEFMERFFWELCKFYTLEDYVYEWSWASTAWNRVPSLIQLLTFLWYVSEFRRDRISYLEFSVWALTEGIFDTDYLLDITDEHFIHEWEREEEIINRLAENYWIEWTRLSTSRVRLTQAQLIFKERLKREYGPRCCLCWIENDTLLIASHIKDAALCDIHWKTDNNNWLLLCAMHDKLFDSRLISFMFWTWRILISNRLSSHDSALCNVNVGQSLPNNLMTEERNQYLMWHNHEFYMEDNR